MSEYTPLGGNKTKTALNRLVKTTAGLATDTSPHPLHTNTHTKISLSILVVSTRRFKAVFVLFPPSGVYSDIIQFFMDVSIVGGLYILKVTWCARFI